MKILDDLAQDESSVQVVLLHPVKLPHRKKITGANTPLEQSCAPHHHHVLTCNAAHQSRETLVVIMHLVDSKKHEVKNKPSNQLEIQPWPSLMAVTVHCHNNPLQLQCFNPQLHLLQLSQHHPSPIVVCHFAYQHV